MSTEDQVKKSLDSATKVVSIIVTARIIRTWSNERIEEHVKETLRANSMYVPDGGVIVQEAEN